MTDALTEWSRRHDDYDVSRSAVVRGWVRIADVIARPLVKVGVHPDVVTVAGVLCAVAATRSSPRKAAAFVVASAVLDGVDGAVAARTGRLRPVGTVVDRIADRVSDALFASALRRSGAPAPLAVAAGIAPLGFEALHALRRHRGQRLDTATVGERPLRVVATVAGLTASPPAGALAVVVQCLIGSGQLARSLRRDHPEGTT